ncbi:MAG: peptide ABC transporter substrate-binding protein, partial [Lentilactobacillus diolivorans]
VDMNHLKNKVTMIIGAAVILTLTGCGKSGSSGPGKLADKQVINLTQNAEVTSVDVSKIFDKNSFNQMDAVGEGLFRYDANGKIHPALATKLTESKNGKTYWIALRKNGRWSNGDKVTAQNFVYSWQRAVNPKTASEYTYLFNGVKNANAIVAGKKPVSSLGVKATDSYHLKIDLEHPIPYFKLILARETLYPLDQRIVDKYGSQYGTTSAKAVYNGPFVMQGWTGSNLNWKLVKNSHYWDKKHVYLKQINYQVSKEPSTAYNMYQSGKLDMISLVGQQAKQLKNNKNAVKRDLAALMYLQYNSKIKALKNKDLRLAISLSLNRNQLTRNILSDGSVPSRGLVPSKFVKDPNSGKDFATAAYVKNTVDYNPTLAQSYWKKAQQEIGRKNMTFNLLCADDDTTNYAVQFISSQVEKNLKGLKLNIQKIPFKTMLTRTSEGQFQMNYIGWSADFADPITFLTLFTSNNSENNGKWSNSTYDQLIKRSNTTDALKPKQRYQDLIQADKILSENQGVTPIYQNNTTDLVNPKLKGVVYDKINGHYDFKSARLVK